MEIKTENNVRLGKLETEGDYLYYMPYNEIKMTEYMLEQTLKIIRKFNR